MAQNPFTYEDAFPAPQREGKAGFGYEEAFPDAKPTRSVARSAGDSAIALGTGVVQGVKMLTDVAGADNPVSSALGDANKALTDLESPYRKAQKQKRADKIKAAEESGSTWEEIKAHAGAFTDAPIDTTLNALGTSAPTIAAAAMTGGTSAAAQVAARAAPVVIGAAQGAGNVKGQIHETVKQKHMAAGMPEAEATERADAAQAYSGENAGSIALGGALGGLAGGSGAETAARNLMGRKLASEAAESAAPGVVRSAVGGVLKEAPMEAAQGGQERLASNTALQGEGFDVPTWQGVAGQAALEGLASAPVGGGFGAVEGLRGRPQPGADVAPTFEPTQEETAPQASPVLALPAPVIDVSADGTASTAADRNARLSRIASGDVTDVTPIPAADPVRQVVAAAAEQGGALSAAALTAIDTGATQVAQAQAQVQAESGLQDAAPETPVEPAPLTAQEQAGVASTLAGRDLVEAPIPSGEEAGLLAKLEEVKSRAAENGSWNVPLMAQRRRIEDALAKLQPVAMPAESQAEALPTPTAVDTAVATEPELSAPTNLREGLARVRAQKQKAANAQAAAPQIAPAAAPVPAAGPAAVETVGTAPTSPTTGVTREPSPPQAQQASPQPAQPGEAPAAEGLNGAGDERRFAPETGTLGIPRAEMPQVPIQSHGGLVKHLNAQGIAHETTTVDAAALKPTQAEYSPAKVEAAKTATGDRAVIVSSDGHVIDGHHQALAAAEEGKPVKAIVLDAPVEQALEAVKNSPSAQATAAEPVAPPTPAKKPRGVLAKKALADEKARADYFTPGNIVKSYGGHDRVVSYLPPDENGRWSVTVKAVRPGNGAWEDVPQLRERVHATAPDAKELKAGPVLRAPKVDAPQTQPAAEPAAASNTPEIVASDASGTSDKTDSGSQPGDELQQAGPPAADPLQGSDQNQPSSSADTASVAIESVANSAAADPRPQRAAAQRPTTKIEDFGETLHGARKMLYTEAYASGMAKAKELDTKAHPLSKTWPEPDYQKLLEGGATLEAVSMARALREAVPNKPQSAWKLKGWSAQVETLRGFAEDVLAGQQEPSAVRVKLNRDSMPRGIADKVALYEAMGHEHSLKGIDVSVGRYSMYDRVEYNPPRTIWSVSREAKGGTFANWPRELAKGDTREEAIAEFKKRAAELLAEEQAPTKGATFEIYSKRAGGAREFFIGKKIGRNVAELKAGFPDLKAARAYKAENQAALEELLAKYKAVPPVRNDQNAPRIGEDYRKGADVTPEQFQEAFGFRGVQFGNYVEGGRRQQDLNRAYDALMDLAGVLTLPPRALSLGGRLGLAFGARGYGGTNAAAAHYERGNVVINLTKAEGAGSLAHEWWHGLDNYFSRQRGEGDGYMTVESQRGDGVREEMRAAFREVMSAINRTGMQERSRKLDDRKTKDYWTTKPEMSARAFESYVISKLQDQNAGNDYLANVLPASVFALEGGYPYPTAGEMPQIRGAFDALFQTVETREGEGGATVLFSRSPDTTTAYEARIDALFAGQPAARVGARVLDRSDVLGLLGLAEKPVVLQESKVVASQSNHPLMTASVWKKLPGWLDNPAAVFDSDTESGRLVFVAPELVSGAPVVMILEPNPVASGKAMSVSLLVNAYDKSGGAPFGRWIADGLMKFADTKTFPAVFAQSVGRRLPDTALKNKPGTERILTEKQLSGYRRANTPAAFQGPVAEASAESNARLVATQVLVDELKSGWTRAPEIIVARNMQDGQIPQRVREYDAQLKSQGSDGEARGFIYQGKVYLLSDQLKGPEQIAEVLFHEVLGHYGLRGAFGKELDPILQQIGTMRRAQVLAKAREYGMVEKGLSDQATWAAMSEGDRLSAAEEVLAEMAQSTPNVGFVQRAVAAIRSWLRANVPGFKALALIDAEIIRSYILPARGFVTRKNETVEQAVGRAMLAFERAGADEEVSFSRAPEGGDLGVRVGDAIKAVTATKLKERAGWKATDLLGLGLQALGRRQIVEIYGDTLPLDQYNKLVQQMEADKNEGGSEADQLVSRWAKLDDERRLAEVMHDATLAQIDADSDVAYQAGDDKAKSAMLKGQFKALSAEAQKVYRDTRDSYQNHHNQVRNAIKERIERSDLKGERKAALLAQMDGEFFKAVKGVYFPLARFGQYVVTVKGADGKVESVSRAETMAEAQALRSNLLSAFPAGKGFAVGRVMLSKDFIADRDAVGRGFMTELYQVLDKQDMDAVQRAELEDTLGQLYLSSLPDLSWAKHGIHRKGTPGFSQDARRAFAQNMFHGARYLAKLRYSDLMQDELAAMQKHVDDWREVPDFDQPTAQRVVDEMNMRHEALMNPKSNALSTALTSFGFIFHLGLSPASAMVNLTQTALVAYPVMGAKWGFGKASAALLKASQQAAKGKNDITASLNADERAAYDEAVRAGTIDVTMAHDLAGIAQGEDAGVMWKLRPVMRWASFMFHHAERFNRQVTFVAAYRLAREAGAAHTAAFEQATKATYDGHFDYGAANRPRLMQGNVAKVLLLFKQYGQNMVYTLVRNAQQSLKGATPVERAQARRALGGLLAMHGLAAGALGLPMVTTLLSAASMLGGDDDEPWDAQVALQNMLADAFGQKPAEVLAHGLSRLTPWDISGRVGLDKLIFPDLQEGLEGQRLGESAMAAALGPVAGIGINALKGLQLMGEGQFLRGLEAMAPSVLRGPLKSIRYGTEGVRDKTGIVVQDEVDAASLLGQAAGFSPSGVRSAYEGKSAIVQHDRALQARRSALVEQFAMAAMAGDEGGKTAAREDIARFNEKNPNRRILPMQLAQSVRQREKRIREAQDGVYLPSKRRDALEAGRFAVAD